MGATAIAVGLGTQPTRATRAGAQAISLAPVDDGFAGVVEGLLRPAIVPRADWAPDLEPIGPLEAEDPSDVRFLLVHHTAQPNSYREESLDRYLRDIHRVHTSEDKGWPDIAYNFLVDRFGTIWEGRTGSIEAPVKGDATGGSQGFAQLCCWVGNHHEESPTTAATAAMEQLLAWLAHRYDIDTTPGTTVDFVSRGSQLHPRGRGVRTATIAGHRDMSATVCPGAFGYPLVTSIFPESVTRLRNRALESALPTTTTSSTTTSTTTTAAPTPSTTTPPTTLASAAPVEGDQQAAALDEGDGVELGWPVGAAVAVSAGLFGAAFWRHRRAAADATERGEADATHT